MQEKDGSPDDLGFTDHLQHCIYTTVQICVTQRASAPDCTRLGFCPTPEPEKSVGILNESRILYISIRLTGTPPSYKQRNNANGEKKT